MRPVIFTVGLQLKYFTNNVVFMADGRNDPDAHIAVIQAAVVA